LQVARYARLVRLPRHVRETEQGFDLRREGKKRRRVVIIKRFGADVIAGAKEDISRAVPKSKRVVPDEVFGAVLTPAFVRAVDELAVSDLARGSPEGRNELVTVINAGIGSEGAFSVLAKQREVLVEGLGGRPEQAVTEADSA
jgi:hypothetical protein